MTRTSFYKASRRLHSDADHLASDAEQKRNVNAGHFSGSRQNAGSSICCFYAEDCSGILSPEIWRAAQNPMRINLLMHQA